jgi:hypothetical protein
LKRKRKVGGRKMLIRGGKNSRREKRGKRNGKRTMGNKGENKKDGEREHKRKQEEINGRGG